MKLALRGIAVIFSEFMFLYGNIFNFGLGLLNYSTGFPEGETHQSAPDLAAGTRKL